MKHIPQRTCIGCNQVEAKRALMRIVRTPEGQVIADPTGKKNGRGTYIHRYRDCWEAVLGKRERLGHALKMDAPIAPQDLATLAEIGQTFPPREAAGNLMEGQPKEPRRALAESAHQNKTK